MCYHDSASAKNIQVEICKFPKILFLGGILLLYVMFEMNLFNLLSFLPYNSLSRSDKVYTEAGERIVFLFNLSYCYVHCVGLIGEIIELCQRDRRNTFCEDLKFYVSNSRMAEIISEHN